MHGGRLNLKTMSYKRRKFWPILKRPDGISPWYFAIILRKNLHYKYYTLHLKSQHSSDCTGIDYGTKVLN